MEFERDSVGELVMGLREMPQFLQIVIGPRQVGKTTAVRQVADRLGWPRVVASADEPLPPGAEWVESQWRLARVKEAACQGPVLLVLDEIQKVAGWSEVVKRLWDEERARKGRIRVVLLGSSALQLHQGMTESLAGRYFLHRSMHWTWPECEKAFGWPLEDWLVFGGYPGAAPLAHDESLWRRYVTDSLVEAVLARDVMTGHRIAKPVLLRHLFALACAYPAQVLSYNKMLGQLVDAGNTTTLAGYVEALQTAFLLSGLQAWSGSTVKQRASSPKLVLWNNALIHAMSRRTRLEVQADATWRGRLVENAVGAHLLCHLPPLGYSVHYWRDGDAEVDFVVARPGQLWALEVKSGRGGKTPGLPAFRKRFPAAKALLIGGGGVPLEEFFNNPPGVWFDFP
jgi:predicted AAA+ superfamily ATPase